MDTSEQQAIEVPFIVDEEAFAAGKEWPKIPRGFMYQINGDGIWGIDMHCEGKKSIMWEFHKIPAPVFVQNCMHALRGLPV